MDLSHEEPHPSWSDGEGLPKEGFLTVTEPSALLCCGTDRVVARVNGLTPTSLQFVVYQYPGGGVHVDGRSPLATKKQRLKRGAAPLHSFVGGLCVRAHAGYNVLHSYDGARVVPLYGGLTSGLPLGLLAAPLGGAIENLAMPTQ